MTNVPQNLRDMWADIYRLFDANYLMPNTEESWNKFWEQAMRIKQKYDSPHMMDLLIIVGDMIGDRQKAEQKPTEGHPCTLEDMNLF